jgi:hypothetical protein
MGFLENLCMGTGKQAVLPFEGNIDATYLASDREQDGGARRRRITRRGHRRGARYDTRKQRRRI